MITPLASNLPCSHCRYNLKTLLPTSLCPECGTPILRTIVHYEQSRARSLGFLKPDDLHNLPFLTLHSFCPYPPAAIRFVHEIANALLAARPSFTTHDFCIAFRNVCLAQFRDAPRALETLTTWNLHSPNDLTQILSLLTQAGLLPPNSHAIVTPNPPLPTLDQLLLNPNSLA